MEKMLNSLEGVVIYFDDILIFGGTLPQHNKNLEKTLERLAANGLTVALEKCFFAQDKINFLGHQIDSKGLNIAAEKTEAVKQVKRPTCVSTLRSFLNLINYYAKFIRNYATIAAPLFTLLKKMLNSFGHNNAIRHL